MERRVEQVRHAGRREIFEGAEVTVENRLAILRYGVFRLQINHKSAIFRSHAPGLLQGTDGPRWIKLSFY